MTYSYNPENINTDDKERMRFEIADTDVSKGFFSAALSDEEITAMLERYSFKRAKFKLVEHLLFKYTQDVDNTVGPASFTFYHRMEFWKKLYDQLKEDDALDCEDLKPYGAEPWRRKKKYFDVGMMSNHGGFTR